MILLSLLCLTGTAQANYVILNEPDTFYYLTAAPGQWDVDGHAVVLGGKRVKVDPFLFCHFTNSNMICAGQTEEFTRKRLSAVGGEKDKTVMVTVAQGQEGLVVVGITPFDITRAYERASRSGSWVLDLKADQVKELGLARYQEKMVQKSRQDWRAFKALAQ